MINREGLEAAITAINNHPFGRFLSPGETATVVIEAYMAELQPALDEVIDCAAMYVDEYHSHSALEQADRVHELIKKLRGEI
jgi:hypothetical protein